METDINFEQMIQQVYTVHGQGQYAEAENGYKKILKQKPDWGPALSALGTLYLDIEQPEKAKPLFERAVLMDPPDLSACYNLGRLKQLEADHRGAISIYKRMLRQRRDSGVVWNNLGVAYREIGNSKSAIDCFHKAVKHAPKMAEAWNNLGVANDESGKSGKAMSAYRKAIEIQPDYLSPRLNLALALQKSQRFTDAQDQYDKVLTLQPDNEVAAFMRQSIKGDETPDAAPVEHVRNIFDQCADKFETVLVEGLAYKTPELLFNLVRPHLTETMEILDLGCGTGLGADYYQPYAKGLTGVDLSTKMLEKAGEKNIYTRLEVFDMLQKWNFPMPFDLIYSSDVFVYLGNLEPVIKSVSASLSGGGIFAFSVEELNEDYGEYKLFPSGRYAHSLPYIHQCLNRHGLEMLGMERADVRNQSGKPVKGLLFAARKKTVT